MAAAKKAKMSMMELAENIVDGGNVTTVKPALKKNLATFVGITRKLRRAALRGESVADLIRLTIEKTHYEEYLRPQPDFDQRWENVQELVSFCFSDTRADRQINYSVTVEEGKEPAGVPEGGASVSSGLASEPVFVAASEVKLPPSKHDEERREAKSMVHPMFKNNKPKRPTRRSPAVKVTDGVVELLDSDEEDVDDVPVVADPAQDQES